MTIICYILFIFFIAQIWLPVIRHFYIRQLNISGELVEKARFFPDKSVLSEINSNEFRGNALDVRVFDREKSIEKADKVLKGIIPGLPGKINFPFNPKEIIKGLPGKQVTIAGFIIPALLLNAYELTKHENYLTTALEIMLKWDIYERKLLLPKGMIWNDYAIAGRSQVLSRFWLHYRNHSIYNAEVAQKLLEMVARGRELLAKPSHFTYATNHGVLQNLALLRLSVAFPTLPNGDAYVKLALSRLHDQFKYYINDEGIVLEHSAKYHEFGVNLIGQIIRYLSLLERPIPKEWIRKYDLSQKYYAQIRRFDGSLPMYGDTKPEKDRLGPAVIRIDKNLENNILSYKDDWMPLELKSIYPVAGYSIWWDGIEDWPKSQHLNQTVVVWSQFQGQGHKHADEMSVLLYAGGQTWWTNAGYWTYGTKGRSEAISWGGSNAPHLVGESYGSVRITQLKHYGWSDKLSVIDLQRNGPGGYMARRQVVNVNPDLWLVVDHTSGDKESRTTTTWTALNDIIINEGELPDSYELRRGNNTISLKTWLLKSSGTINRHKGSYMPFAGWVQNKPAEAITIEQPANNSWSIAVWSLDNNIGSSRKNIGKPYMHKWRNPESWEVAFTSGTGQLSIGREGNAVYVNDERAVKNMQELKLIKGPAGTTDDHNVINTAFRHAANKYKKFSDLLYYRWKMTYLIIFLLISQEIAFFVYKKFHVKHYRGVRFISLICWTTLMALWQLLVYVKA